MLTPPSQDGLPAQLPQRARELGRVDVARARYVVRVERALQLLARRLPPSEALAEHVLAVGVDEEEAAPLGADQPVAVLHQGGEEGAQLALLLEPRGRAIEVIHIWSEDNVLADHLSRMTGTDEPPEALRQVKRTVWPSQLPWRCAV